MSLEVKNVVSGYGDAIVLNGVSVTAKSSAITVLLGANGAGKSTLLNTIFGLLKPRSGEIIFEGKEITGMKTHSNVENGIAYVPQQRSTFPYMKVSENLKLGAWKFKRDKNKIKSKMEEMYELFPILKDRKDIDAGRLSGGEQRMLEVARALMSEPKLLMLDEPSMGLAPKIVDLLFQKIKELNNKFEVTILLAEQNVLTALENSHYAYIIELGRNKVDGPSKSLLKDRDLSKYILGI
jgi:ABC-type branched-subunit amino acid transport system ATPase component